MKDTVVYILTTPGGGVDGRDSSDRPTDYVAYFDKNEALAAIEKAQNGYKPSIRAELIDLDEVYGELMRSLTPVQKAVMKALEKGLDKMFGTI